MEDGTVERQGQRFLFRYECLLNQAQRRVWDAITDPIEIERWTGNRPQLDLRPGGEYVVSHRNGMHVVDHVLEVDPPTRFVHTFWEATNPDAQVTWMLSARVEGSILRLTHVMSEADIRAAASTVARRAASGHRLA